METFWNTIASYNAATWPAQLALTLAAVVLTLLLYFRPSPAVRIAMKVFMALLNFWIAGVYYLVCCEPREHHDLLALFWAIMGCIWVYDRAAERLGGVVLALACDQFEPLAFHRVGVGLEDQRLRLRSAAEEDLRGDLLVVVVQDDDVVRRHAFERGDFGPGDFDGFVIAFGRGRVGDFDLQSGCAGGRQEGCNPHNRFFHKIRIEVFPLFVGKFTIFPYIGQPKR